METYLQGRKIPAVRGDDRPSLEALQFIRKLRWMGMEQEAEKAQMELRHTRTAGAVVTSPYETD